MRQSPFPFLNSSWFCAAFCLTVSFVAVTEKVSVAQEHEVDPHRRVRVGARLKILRTDARDVEEQRRDDGEPSPSAIPIKQSQIPYCPPRRLPAREPVCERDVVLRCA